MTYEVFFAGAGGTLVGGVIACWLTYAFQKKLLRQQLDFQRQLLEQQLAFTKEQAVEDAKVRRQIYDEWRAVFQEFRNMVNVKGGMIAGELSALVAQRQPRADSTPQR